MAKIDGKGLFLRILSFAKTALLHPRSVGAILPSSHFLAESMAQCIDRNQTGFVLELGPGTGVITRAILQSGIPAKQLIAVELSVDFATELQKEFPDILIIHGDALHLSELIKNKNPVNTIISALPLRNFPNEDRDNILAEIQKVLAPQGKFIQFSYAIKDDPKYYPQGMTLINSFIVWRNLPPARVNVFQNKWG